MWLAQSHVVVARKRSGLHVCIPDSKAVFGQQGPGPGWETSISQHPPLLLPIQMPAPGYSHLFSRGRGGLLGASPLGDGGAAVTPAAQLSGSHPSMWKAMWAAVLPRSQSTTKENMECFLDDTVSNPSHAFLWEGCEEGLAVCRSGALLRHPVLSADVGPRAVSTAKDSQCR